MFSGCLCRQSELHKNCSSVSELATNPSGSSSQQPSLPSLHADMDCSWKPFGLYPPDIRGVMFCFEGLNFIELKVWGFTGNTEAIFSVVESM